MKAPCVSQLELVATGFEPSFTGLIVARPEGVDVPAVETNRRNDTESASPLNANRKRRAAVTPAKPDAPRPGPHPNPEPSRTALGRYEKNT